MEGRTPLPAKFNLQVQLQQLALTIHAGGLNLVVSVPRTPSYDQAITLVRSLEWLAENGPLPVVVLLPKGAMDIAPLQRILYGAWALSWG